MNKLLSTRKTIYKILFIVIIMQYDYEIKANSEFIYLQDSSINVCDTVKEELIDISVNNTQDEEVLIFVEEMPQYPGGVDALLKYLIKNIKYPAYASKHEISGRVILQFIVNKTGDVSNVKVIRGIGGGCDEEAVRVVKAMPRWKPGFQKGKIVPVYYTLPILFTLKDDKKDNKKQKTVR